MFLEETRASVTGENTLVVDLDGTLFKGDFLWETLAFHLARSAPAALRAIAAVARGRGALKAALARRYDVDLSTLPINSDVIEMIHQARLQGNRVVLATGTSQELAEKIAETLGMFDEVHGSTEYRNLTGKIKADFLRGRFSDNGFFYVGNSPSDLFVFRVAKGGYLVSRSDRLWNVARKVNNNLSRASPSRPASAVLVWLRAIRVHQWVKNFLLFLIPVTAQALSLENFASVLIAFLAFSLISSATYLINDILDLAHDRTHPSKKRRPLANGDISIPFSIFISIVFAVAAAVFAFFGVGLNLFLFIVSYGVASLSYSLFLKKLLVLDVLWLAGLYTFRIAVGGVLVDEQISVWLLTFSLFTFFSLAVLKRVVEAGTLKKSSSAPSGRGYLVTDETVLKQVGVASGLVSVLVLALYSREYVEAEPLSGLSPLFLWVPIWLYWVVRIWVLAARGAVHEDPIFFSLKDPVSWFAGSALIVIALVAL